MAVGRLALIGGHSILDVDVAAAAAEMPVETEYGSVALLDAGSHLVLQRHGLGGYTTAAKINHQANIAALADSGVDRILALNSVGGLKADLGPGTFICPDDFIALHLGLSFSDQHDGERVPGFDPGWRTRVLEAWAAAPGEPPPLRDGGVYWQAIGPRFETPAEIRLISSHADVIGMTMASELILAGEREISYCSVAIVDNLANGISGKRLTEADFEAGKQANRDRLLAALEGVIPSLAAAE